MNKHLINYISNKLILIYNCVKLKEMIKILIIGNSYTGKTSVVNRFVQNKFDEHYKATVACDFSMKIIKIEDTELRLQLWDLVG